MGFFDTKEGVEQYVKMAEGYDGAELIAILKKHLKSGSTVLELGMGPGIDLDILKQTYKVTGSDNSNLFLDLYRKKHPDADLLLLDAIHFDTDRKFDCIYSNKVLHHLTTSELRNSFQQQWERLTDNGVLMHSFWYGDHVEEHEGMRFVHYTEESLIDAIGSRFEMLKLERYTEMEKDDSLLCCLKKKVRKN